MTIKKILKKYSGQTLLDAEIILANIIKQDKIFILSHPEKEISWWQNFIFQRQLKKLIAGWPVSYLVGRKDFFGLEFLINKYTLIPRPDTETMVAKVLEILNNATEKHILIDLGTGSGCIPVAVGANLKQQIINKQLTIYASDISNGALKIARKNSQRFQIKIIFKRGDLLTPWKKLISHTDNIIVTANLPYLTKKQFADEPSIQHEPYTALVSDENTGLNIYKKLLLQITEYPNKKWVILLEIDPTQVKEIASLLKNILPAGKIEIKKDLAGRDRLVIVNIN